jgi:hypothetical protein
MSTIREQIIDKIAEIGAGETLLIFTKNQKTFIKFEAKLNGQIQMTGHDGETIVHLAREYISKVVEDFSVIEQIKELPLKTVKINADGQLQVDDDPDTYLTADEDGIADRSMVPLGEQIRAAVSNILPDLTAQKMKDIRGDGSSFSCKLDNNFSLWIESSERLNRLQVRVSLDNVTDKQVEAFKPFAEMRILPYMVWFNNVKTENYQQVIEFRVELLLIPFIGQHLSAALINLAEAMKIWIEYNGGQID